jgi:uncharacterized protein YidB (DUF937 family)
MSLLSSILGAFGFGGQASPQSPDHGKLMSVLTGMLCGPNSPGLAGLLEKLKTGGLGNAVQSWIGTGQNQPVSGDEVRSALGDDHVEQIAREAGMSTEQAFHGLASLLPQLVDRLSPDGKLPESSQLSDIFCSFKEQLMSGPKQ